MDRSDFRRLAISAGIHKEASSMETRRKAVRIAVIALVALLLSAAAVQAEAIMTTFTGTEGPCAPIEEGDTFVLPSGNVHLRGMAILCRDQMSDPRVTGNNTIVINGNLDPAGTGPVWGTWELQVDGGGAWAGTWAGTKTETGFLIHAQGDGSGIYEGLLYSVEGQASDMRGRILDPHGAE